MTDEQLINNRKAIGEFLDCDLEFEELAGMTMSELIERLKEAKKIVGDVEVLLSTDHFGNDYLPLYALEVREHPQFVLLRPQCDSRKRKPAELMKPISEVEREAALLEYERELLNPSDELFEFVHCRGR
jgi:hypothetical protein